MSSVKDELAYWNEEIENLRSELATMEAELVRMKDEGIGDPGYYQDVLNAIEEYSLGLDYALGQRAKLLKARAPDA